MANFGQLPGPGGSATFGSTSLFGSGSNALSQAVGPNPAISAFPMVNTISLGQYVLPGKWTLHKAERVFGWQIKVSYGLTGAMIVPSGDPLMEIQFRGEFWAQSDYQKFRQIRALLLAQSTCNLPGAAIQIGGQVFLGGAAVTNANTGATAKITFAAGIVHPELNDMGINAVVNYKIGAAIDRGGGLWEIRADFLEFRPPIAAKAQPKQVIAPAPQAPPIANSPNSARVAEAQAEAAAAKAKAAAAALLTP